MRLARCGAAVPGHRGRLAAPDCARTVPMTAPTEHSAGAGPEHCALVRLSHHVEDAASGDEVSVGDVVAAIGARSVLPLLLVPALVAATPLSGIPGMSALCGILIALISLEMILRFDHVWLPDRLMRQRVQSDRVRGTMRTIRPWLARIDRLTRNRLDFLFHRPLLYVPQLLCLLSGLVMPFLEFVPFSGSVAATGVCLLALSLLTRDGLFFLLALGAYAGLGALVWRVIG